MSIIYAPVPWVVRGHSILAVDHGVRFSIARVGNTKLSPQGIAGTAQLMAAAPDLLEALHQISLCSKNSMSSSGECGTIARAAIAKAEGT